MTNKGYKISRVSGGLFALFEHDTRVVQVEVDRSGPSLFAVHVDPEMISDKVILQILLQMESFASSTDEHDDHQRPAIR